VCSGADRASTVDIGSSDLFYWDRWTIDYPCTGGSGSVNQQVIFLNGDQEENNHD
jgi:hypothetical protein